MRRKHHSLRAQRQRQNVRTLRAHLWVSLIRPNQVQVPPIGFDWQKILTRSQDKDGIN